MNEERIPYTTSNSNHSRYPGSRLEIVVEALDDLREHAPACYTQRVAEVHTRLSAVLRGGATPATTLIGEMLRQPE